MQSQNIFLHNNHNQKITTIINNKRKSNITGNKSITIPPPRSNGSTTQACAACKYQRRKCASDCILAPYFPHDRQRQFLNAHRLFGVSNIVKIIRHLEPPARDHAMSTIMFQSNARAVDPIGGCYRIIRDLEQQITLANAELEIVLHHLALCREAASTHHLAPPPPPPNVGDSTISGDPLGSYNQEFGGKCAVEDEVVVVDDDANSWGCIYENVNGVSTTPSPFPPPHHHHHHMRSLPMEECNHDMKPVLDHLSCDDDDDDQTYGKFEFDDLNGNIRPSNNPILREENATILKEEDVCSPYVQDHRHLKSPASFFTLTNCDF
ncbi:hypothetical protein BUALT_Bualt02G0121200 [Buddleja alternifolia]|uniref:LOB domain-containing protein n=1 Tax=Buddleja alternifolia TaxID=168488 RepID=A0AAV6Y1P3_9LAMI|nr:hypothetical protein BUALT_Bualt02G0121200 [Buddleja alternifolia]